jgi:hypothetical protein
MLQLFGEAGLTDLSVESSTLSGTSLQTVMARGRSLIVIRTAPVLHRPRAGTCHPAHPKLLTCARVRSRWMRPVLVVCVARC